MLTVNYFDKLRVDELVVQAREYISIYAYTGKIDECEVPFKISSTGEIKYVQFALLAGNWVYVRVR